MQLFPPFVLMLLPRTMIARGSGLVQLVLSCAVGYFGKFPLRVLG